MDHGVEDREAELISPSDASRGAAAAAHRGVPLPRSRLLAEIAATLLLMGLVPILIRHVSANVVTIGIVRLAIACAGIGAWVAATRTPVSTRPADLRALALIGVLFGVHWLMYFAAIKTGGAGIAAIGQSTFGAHLVLIGWFVGHHRVRAVDLVAVALAVAGTLLVAPEWDLSDRGTAGLALAVISAFLYAFLPVLHQRHAHLPSRVRVLGQFVFAFPCFAVLFPWSEWQLPASDWVWLAVLGLGSTIVAHTLWTHLSTVLPTLTTSVVFYMSVPVALVLSVIVLGEAVTAWMIAGAALIVFGNVLAFPRRG